MNLLWLAALGVSCIAVGIVLIGVGYLMGLRVATRQAAGLVASVREEIDHARYVRFQTNPNGITRWGT